MPHLFLLHNNQQIYTIFMTPVFEITQYSSCFRHSFYCQIAAPGPNQSSILSSHRAICLAVVSLSWQCYFLVWQNNCLVSRMWFCALEVFWCTFGLIFFLTLQTISQSTKCLVLLLLDNLYKVDCINFFFFTNVQCLAINVSYIVPAKFSA